MYKCLKCNKEFKYKSELIIHKNKKIPCDSPKKEYKCNACNVSFARPAEQKLRQKNNLKSK
jgi:DNA-directed RNA polymerase subunit RPC12/RpoP